MRKYWSCTKFADMIRGTPKLKSGTVEEWNDWHKAAKANKIRYWIAEDLLSKLGDIWCWLPNKAHRVASYLNNRFVSHTHAMTSTTLKKGDYHEFEDRLIHSMFGGLTDFVEIELAYSHIAWEGLDKEYGAPWWVRNRLTGTLFDWRCPQAGIDRLQWEMSLTYDSDCGIDDESLIGKPTVQAIAAREKWALYYWWKFVRPCRVDPFEYSGLKDFYESRRDGNNDIFSLWVTTNDDREIRRALHAKSSALERQYNAEDEEMMGRLVKIRSSIYT